MIKYFIIFIFSIFAFINSTSAATYNSTEDLFSNTQADYLVQYANSYIENFTSKKFVIFRNNDNYYIVVSKDAYLENNNLVFNNSTIISAIRNKDSSYYAYYSYSVSNESNTIVNLNNIVISNIYSNKSVTSSIFRDYKFKQDIINVSIFVLGLIFANFVTKERRY